MLDKVWATVNVRSTHGVVMGERLQLLQFILSGGISGIPSAVCKKHDGSLIVIPVEYITVLDI